MRIEAAIRTAHALRARRWQVGKRAVPYLMFLPAGALLLLLNYFTSSYGVYISFLDFNYFQIERRFEFVGFSHYAEVLQDPVFWTAAKQSAIWVSGVVPASFLLGLYFALLLNEQVAGKAVLRTLLLTPWFTPLVVVAIIWSFILSPDIGPLTELLVRLGFVEAKYTYVLADPALALPIVMAVQVWRWIPFFAVTLLAGLQSIPKDLYDAAEVDGANAIGRFGYITLPLLAPVILVLLLQGVIWSAHNFSLVFIMTGGGPVYATEVLTTHIWRTAFPNAQLGQAAAVGTLLIIALSIVGTFWVLRLLRRQVAA